MTLLDTHVLVWMHLDTRHLGRRARALLDQAWPDGEAAVSTITFWEVAMLQRKGRVGVTRDVLGWRAGLRATGLGEVGVTAEIATLAGEILDMHGDPADRIIAATALTLDDCRLLTADERLLDWPGEMDRVDARR